MEGEEPASPPWLPGATRRSAQRAERRRPDLRFRPPARPRIARGPASRRPRITGDRGSQLASGPRGPRTGRAGAGHSLPRPPRLLLYVRKPLTRSLPGTSWPRGPRMRMLAAPTLQDRLRGPVGPTRAQGLARQARKRRAVRPTAWPFRAVTTSPSRPLRPGVFPPSSLSDRHEVMEGSSTFQPCKEVDKM